MHTGWVASHLPDIETIGYLDAAIPGPTSIMDLRGSLGRALQHTLLRPEPGRQWPRVEHWDLDWATADPAGYHQRHAPTRLTPASLVLGEQLEDLDPRRTRR